MQTRSKVADHDSENRRQNNNVPAQKSRQTSRTRLNLPRTRSPSSNNRRDKSTSLDIEVLGREESQIVASGNGVGRDIGTQRCKTEGKGDEESSGAIRPEADDHCWVPEQFTVDCLTG